MRQAIIWTNVDPVHRRINVALGGEEFIYVSLNWCCLFILHKFYNWYLYTYLIHINWNDFLINTYNGLPGVSNVQMDTMQLTLTMVHLNPWNISFWWSHWNSFEDQAVVDYKCTLSSCELLSLDIDISDMYIAIHSPSHLGSKKRRIQRLQNQPYVRLPFHVNFMVLSHDKGLKGN